MNYPRLSDRVKPEHVDEAIASIRELWETYCQFAAAFDKRMDELDWAKSLPESQQVAAVAKWLPSMMAYLDASEAKAESSKAKAASLCAAWHPQSEMRALVEFAISSLDRRVDICRVLISKTKESCDKWRAANSEGEEWKQGRPAPDGDHSPGDSSE